MTAQVIPLAHPAQAGRTIAVFHRVKKTVDQEERPTLVSIRRGEETIDLELATEREEFDFITRSGDYVELGLSAGDTVITALGGSGDRLAFAMSRFLKELGGTLWRIPGFRLKEARDTQQFAQQPEEERTNVRLLHHLFVQHPAMYFECRVRDRETIKISELYRQFKEAQLERMKCAGRLRARMIGQFFLSEEGGYPEGKIEDWFDAKKATDPIYQALLQEEKQAKSTLERALKDTRIAELFEDVPGCGPSVIGGLVCAIGDIRRFPSAANLVSYFGLAVLKEDGTKAKKGEKIERGLFPRQRRGMRTSWNRGGRQTLYTLADQFNRRPESEWGKRLLANKTYYRTKHPHTVLIEYVGQEATGRVFELVPGTFEKKGTKYLLSVDGVLTEVRGKQRYYDGHIHRMAIWKTLHEFVHWLYVAWTEFEKAEYIPKEKKVRGRKAA